MSDYIAQIKTENKLQRQIVATVLSGFGFTPLSKDTFSYPIIVVRHDKIVTGDNSHNDLFFCRNSYHFNELEEFIKYITDYLARPQQIEVSLNAEYKAIVTKNGIKVGCQTFAPDIIEKLAAAYKSLSE